MEPTPQTYEEFWPYYVAQHRLPTTRGLHFLGTSLTLSSLAASVWASPWWLAVAPVAGYGPAWVGHFFFERNRPATFRFPLWSLRADFRMFRLTILGRMQAELERAAKLYPEAA